MYLQLVLVSPELPWFLQGMFIFINYKNSLCTYNYFSLGKTTLYRKTEVTLAFDASFRCLSANLIIFR